MAAPHPESGEVILIPKTFASPAHLQAVVERYKNIRLHGLQVDPQSFSSTYEEESRYPYETWLSRIQNPVGKTFVSMIKSSAESKDGGETAAPEETEGVYGVLQRSLGQEWVGIVTLLGPVPLSSESGDATTRSDKPWEVFLKGGKYHIPLTAFESSNLHGVHTVYVIVGMFVLPHARRKGHACRLLQATVDAVHEEAQALGASKASITVQVESGNANAKQLYEKVGFEVWDDAVVIEDRRGGTSHTVVSLVREIQTDATS